MLPSSVRGTKDPENRIVKLVKVYVTSISLFLWIMWIEEKPVILSLHTILKLMSQ